jgi:hypothetical protein
MSENVPIEIPEGTAAQSVFCKTCFFGTNSRISEIAQSVLGFEFPDSQFPEFVPEGLKKALFFIHL